MLIVFVVTYPFYKYIGSTEVCGWLGWTDSDRAVEFCQSLSSCFLLMVHIFYALARRLVHPRLRT